MRALAATVLAAVSLLVAASGLQRLVALSTAYRTTDLAFTQSDETFQAWLAARDLDADDPVRVSSDVAARLMFMPLDRRRSITLAMATRSFWEPFASKGKSPRGLQLAVLGGIYLSLSKAPVSGDLYFAAASLEIMTGGVSAKARQLIGASQLYAARELPFVHGRLAMAPLLWPQLQAEERGRFAADFKVIQVAEPERAGEIAALLAKDGVTF